MRICYLADAGSIHTQRWVKHFAAAGHEVHLISCESFEQNYGENVRLYALKQHNPRIRIMSPLIDAMHSVIRVRKLLRRIAPDVLHAHYVGDFGFLGSLTGFHPLIVSAWGSDVLVGPAASTTSRIIVKHALRKADLTLATCQYLKGYLHSEFKLPESKVLAYPWGSDLRIFYNGYETEVKELRAKSGVDDGSFVILSPRCLKSHYGIEYIVHSMPYIVAEYPTAILMLLSGQANDSEYRSRIARLTAELGVARNVRVIDEKLEQSKMAVYYNMCDVFLSVPRTDQFACSIVEGMACGAIPIVGKLEAYSEYLTDGENALFVDRKNPKDIAQKVIHCIEHRQLKERFYRANRSIVEEYLDWDKNAPIMEGLYVSLSERQHKADVHHLGPSERLGADEGA